LDLFSRQVVGWSMSTTEDGELVEFALRMAVARRHPEASLLHHSDRGTEFTCDRDLPALRELGVEVSMSRTGNCWDNAAMEAFFATLAKECVNRVKYQTRQEARSSIFEYIECFYNPIRLHSTLQYISPVAYEQANCVKNELVVHKP
jgi:putative transposase